MDETNAVAGAPRATGEAVAWDLATVDAVAAKLRKLAGMSREYHEISDTLRERYREDARDLLCVIPHPAPRGRVVTEAVEALTAAYRMIAYEQTPIGWSVDRIESARDALAALVDANYEQSRGRVVLTNQWAVVGTDGERSYTVESREEAARLCAPEDSLAPGNAPHRVMRLALVDADAGEVDRG